MPGTTVRVAENVVSTELGRSLHVEGNVAGVLAQLQAVIVKAPAEAVAQLKALLAAVNCGLRIASKECLARPENVDADALRLRSRCRIESQPTPRELESQFVEFRSPDQHHVRGQNRYVTILLLIGAAESSLSRDLALNLAGQAGDRAGAHVGSQEKLLHVGQLVVEPRSPETGAFFHRGAAECWVGGGGRGGQRRWPISCGRW